MFLQTWRASIIPIVATQVEKLGDDVIGLTKVPHGTTDSVGADYNA